MSGAVASEAGFRLETGRLVLRDWREADWPRFFGLTNTARVMRWLGGVMDDGAKAELRRRIETCAARHGHCFWLLERREDGGHLAGEVLGFCGLKRNDAPASPLAGEVEIGWRLRADAWGLGYAREAAAAALAAGFERFGAERIIALTVIGNAPSTRLMERLGMERRPELDHRELRYGTMERDAIVHAAGRGRWVMARG